MRAAGTSATTPNSLPRKRNKRRLSEQQRNFTACKDGQETCDYAKLTPTEAKTLADAEHKRNYAACLKGYGYCDPSRLTAEESSYYPPWRLIFKGAPRNFLRYGAL